MAEPPPTSLPGTPDESRNSRWLGLPGVCATHPERLSAALVLADHSLDQVVRICLDVMLQTDRREAGVRRIALEGALLLTACAVAFAILGLTPSLSWIPEIPLLVAAAIIPTLLLVWTGTRAARSRRSVAAGLIAAALAGAVGGLAGGAAYVAYGKSIANLLVGLAVGLGVGASLGALAAAIVLRPLQRPRDPAA